MRRKQWTNRPKKRLNFVDLELMSKEEATRKPNFPSGGLDCQEVLKILPHRYPFVMVDRILSVTEDTIVGLKNLTLNEPFFQGHFPSRPVMPGVLQLEAIAQVAGIFATSVAARPGTIAYFMSADKVKFRRPVAPGDQLRIEVKMLKYGGKIGKASGTCLVDGEVASEGLVTFMLSDPE